MIVPGCFSTPANQHKQTKLIDHSIKYYELVPEYSPNEIALPCFNPKS